MVSNTHLPGPPGDDPASTNIQHPFHPWTYFRTWFLIGIQSFGGGTTTLLLIQRNVVDRYSWLTQDEFTRAWAVCQIAPGINLLSITILVGWRVMRGVGVVLGLLGLLLPSVAVTILLTALYAEVQQLPVIQAALRGVIPATVGLGVMLSVRLAQPLLQASRREGRASLGTSIAILIGCGLLLALSGISVISIIWGAGILGAVSHGLRERLARAKQERA